MSYANGQFPASALARIPDPVQGGVGQLRADAAAAWNAMSAEAVRRYGIALRPLGPNSTYRTVPMQRNMKRLYGSNAADPGTSNHGLALAVDVATKKMRWVIDQIGAAYGWAKKWSDAAWEWWHMKWRPGVWSPPKVSATPTLKRGDTGASVRKLQRSLRAVGFKSVQADGAFGAGTVDAVKRFQKSHKIKADGVVGATTWKELRRVLS